MERRKCKGQLKRIRKALTEALTELDLQDVEVGVGLAAREGDCPPWAWNLLLSVDRLSSRVKAIEDAFDAFLPRSEPRE